MTRNRVKSPERKRHITLIFTLFLFIFVIFSDTAFALPGSGEPNDPWRIESLDDFNEFAADANFWDDCTRLETDINLAGLRYTTAIIAPDINDANIHFQGVIPDFGAFGGTFNGNNHTIFSFFIDGTGSNKDHLGLFGYIDYSGKVINLKIENVKIIGDHNLYNVGGLCGGNDGDINNSCVIGFVTGDDDSTHIGGLCGENSGTIVNCYAAVNVTGFYRLGGLCGSNMSGTISNCYATGSITGSSWYVGGLCGFNVNSTISNCYATGSVHGNSGLGGLCGGVYEYCTILNCYATGSVTSSDDSEYLGGLCGSNSRSEISNCYATGSVTAGNNSDGLGGLCGYIGGYGSLYCKIRNCFATGLVTGGDNSRYLGGLCGYNDNSEINNCYSIGEVTGDYALGGLIGEGSPSDVTNSFWDVNTSDCNQSAGGTGLTTEQMQTKSTFTSAGWDFVGETKNGHNDIWTINENIDYPKHVWKLVNFTGWYEVDFADYSFFSGQWMQTSCVDANDCDGTDLDFSGKVDFNDLDIFCNYWLKE